MFSCVPFKVFWSFPDGSSFAEKSSCIVLANSSINRNQYTQTHTHSLSERSLCNFDQTWNRRQALLLHCGAVCCYVARYKDTKIASQSGKSGAEHQNACVRFLCETDIQTEGDNGRNNGEKNNLDCLKHKPSAVFFSLFLMLMISLDRLKGNQSQRGVWSHNFPINSIVRGKIQVICLICIMYP